MFESVSTPALGVSDTRSIMLADCRRRRGYRPSTPKAHWRREFRVTYTEGASTFSTELEAEYSLTVADGRVLTYTEGVSTLSTEPTAENSLTVADGRVLTYTEGDAECSLITRVQ